MIIYKDPCTGDELFSDSFKLAEEGPDNFFITIPGKTITRAKGGDINPALIGGNASQEEEQEACEDAGTESGIDVALIHELTDQTDFFNSKKALQSYVKKWLKNTADALSKEDEKKCECFKKSCSANIKLFIDKWSPEVSVYAGAKFDPSECKSSLLIGVWNDDGMGLTFYGIKDSLIEEKC